MGMPSTSEDSTMCASKAIERSTVADVDGARRRRRECDARIACEDEATARTTVGSNERTRARWRRRWA